MSEIPNDAPSVSLSEEEDERYHEAVSFVLNRKDQSSLKLVIGNYGEFRAIQFSMAIIFTTTKQANWCPDPRDSLFHPISVPVESGRRS